MPLLGSHLRDRQEAGVRLAGELAEAGTEHPLVLGLPRGGVVVASEIASRLHAPLDVLIVRKVGAPGNPEYGLGTVVEGGAYSLDTDRVRESGYTTQELEPTIERERQEARRRADVYRAVRPRVPRAGRTVIVVDDGAATGGTLRASLRVVRAEGARRVVAALGVAPADLCRTLEREADELVVLLRPRLFYAVGQFYDRFEPVEEDEVLELLRRSMEAGPVR